MPCSQRNRGSHHAAPGKKIDHASRQSVAHRRGVLGYVLTASLLRAQHQKFKLTRQVQFEALAHKDRISGRRYQHRTLIRDVSLLALVSLSLSIPLHARVLLSQFIGINLREGGSRIRRSPLRKIE